MKLEKKNEAKILLLGAGESGKSTIFKQMKLLYQLGFNNDEKKIFQHIIYTNIITAMRDMISYAESQPATTVAISDENQNHVDIVRALNLVNFSWSSELKDALTRLWDDPAIQNAYQNGSRYNLSDSAGYFCRKIPSINADYLPSEQDILHSRVRTTRITEIAFEYGGLAFTMYDVGGQRSERRKWFHCFQNVTSVIFCTSLSEYDQYLFEDNTQPRMKESMLLFNEICNSKWFIDTNMILFLNKKDVFQEKIMKVNLNVCFPECDTNDYQKGADYIASRFVALNRNENKKIYTHFTCATNTDNIKFCMVAVKDIILQENLKNSGF